MDDHILLLLGAAEGYPLPSQHPARQLEEGDRFDRALDVAAAADTLRVTNGNKLVLTEAGRALLASSTHKLN